MCTNDSMDHNGYTESTDQLANLRGVLKTADGRPQVKNWRFMQQRNGRPIYVSSGTKSIGQSEALNEIIDIDFKG